MHDGGIELDHAVSIRQPAVSDTVVEWIKLDDIHARDYGIEYIGATAHHLKSFLHRGHVAAVFEPIAVSRRDDQRLHGLCFMIIGKAIPAAAPVTMKSRRFIFVMVSSVY